MKNTHQRSTSVLLDFDGTITMEDIGDKIVKGFARPGWEPAYKKLLAGEMAIREAWAIEAAHLRRDSEAEMIKFALNEARIRPGLPEFLDYAARTGLNIEVVSSGFDFYVDAILKRFGMSDVPRSRPTLLWDATGAGTLVFENGLRDCASTALCKCARIWSHRRQGRRVIFVGDGLSDVCAAGQADFLLARGRLAEMAPSLEVDFRKFDDFHDVRREVQQSLEV